MQISNLMCPFWNLKKMDRNLVKRRDLIKITMNSLDFYLWDILQGNSKHEIDKMKKKWKSLMGNGSFSGETMNENDSKLFFNLEKNRMRKNFSLYSLKIKLNSIFFRKSRSIWKEHKIIHRLSFTAYFWRFNLWNSNISDW